MKYLVALLGFLLFAATAHAELAVCFHGAKPLGSQFSHNPSVDPSKVTDVNCFVVPHAQTASQLALINSTIRGAPASKYLKIVSGLATQMTTGEMDAVDADLAAKAAAQQVYIDEVNNQDFCNVANLDVVDQKIDQFYDASATVMQAAITQANTDLAAVTNAVTTANMTAMKTAVTSVKNATSIVGQELAGQRVAMKKLLRCLISVRKGAR